MSVRRFDRSEKRSCSSDTLRRALGCWDSGLLLEPAPKPPAHVEAPDDLLDRSPGQEGVVVRIRLRAVDAQGAVVFSLDPDVQAVGPAPENRFDVLCRPHTLGYPA